MSDRLLQSARKSITRSFEIGESSPHDQEPEGFNRIYQLTCELVNHRSKDTQCAKSELFEFEGRLLVLLKDMGVPPYLHTDSVRLHSLIEMPKVEIGDAYFFSSTVRSVDF